MNKNYFVIAMIAFCCTVNAKPKGNLSRGGLGFLFPDANSFENPGQFTLTQATSVEAYYTRRNLSQSQALVPSIVYGNGRFGLGVFAARASTNLASKDSTDMVGAGLGVGLAKNRITVGAEYDRIISSLNNNTGTVRGTVTLNPAGAGPSVGVGAFSTLNSGTKTQGATVGLGMMTKSALLFEVNATSNDLKDSTNMVGSGFVTLQSQKFYLGGGYNYHRSTKYHEVQTRLGLVFGQSFDFSLHAEKVLVATSQATYGGSVRAAF